MRAKGGTIEKEPLNEIARARLLDSGFTEALASRAIECAALSLYDANDFRRFTRLALFTIASIHTMMILVLPLTIDRVSVRTIAKR